MGDRDAAAGNVSVRLRTDEDLGAMPLDQFVQLASGIYRLEVAGVEVVGIMAGCSTEHRANTGLCNLLGNFHV
ncbi:MAG: hypothetical protein U0521_15385 [Anaerolineae bacterium]